MKKLLLTSIFLAFFISLSFSQINYTFELDSAEYIPIKDEFTAISGFDQYWLGSEYWDDIPIGFTFTFMGFEYDVFDLFTTDLIFNDTIHDDDALRFVPYSGLSGDNLISYDTSSELTHFPPIIYKTEGTLGNRIFTLEYNMAQFWDDPGLDEPPFYTYYTNYQVRIYEGSNIIEVHYGPHLTDEIVFTEDGGPGPIVGMVNFNDDENDADDFVFIVHGDPINPTIITEETDTNSYNYAVLDYSPPEGIIYRFIPNSVGTKDIAQKEQIALKVMPNPSTDIIYVIASEEKDVRSFRLTDMLGRTIYEAKTLPEFLDVSKYDPGMYNVQVVYKTGQVFASKVLKVN